MNVAKLVKEAKGGNKEALLALIMEKRDDYYRLAISYMGNQQDAMDAMEDMILVLYEKIDQLKKEESFYFWSKKILINSCKSLLRKRNNVIYMEDMTPFAEKQWSPQNDPYANRERRMDIRALLSHLSENQREAILLKYVHDLDYETISKLTDVPVGTVKSRIFQGIKKLNRLYGGEFDEKYE